ncbi:Transcriptional regulator, DeoR family [hydrothermal vent metagenome]|uniref:Transcriptional regulator, DeoR family n=1 Tax=hydrothermal vent metagenome TaxID=652676 RepID=A0A3B0SFG5_9ZZZZ
MRASRLLSILILLQLRGRLTAEYLAEEFEVSVRTIYRDIDALSAAGIPVYGDAGPGGGFQLLDGYRTKLTGLGPEEAEAMLLIGLPGAAQAMGLGEAANRARNKLLVALPGTGRDEADRIAERFHLDTADWYRAARPTPLLARVARAVLDRQLLAMTYQSWTARCDWTVEPFGLVLKAGHWYLVAKGHGKLRCFNVADILALDVLPDRFNPPSEFNLATWWVESARSFEEQLRPGIAVLAASPIGLQRLRLLGSFAGEAVAKAEPTGDDGWHIVKLPLETIESAAPALLGIGPEIDVIEPIALGVEIARLAGLVVQRMKSQLV